MNAYQRTSAQWSSKGVLFSTQRHHFQARRFFCEPTVQSARVILRQQWRRQVGISEIAICPFHTQAGYWVPLGVIPNTGVNCLYGVLYIDIFWYQDSWYWFVQTFECHPFSNSPAVPIARVRVAEWMALKSLDKSVPWILIPENVDVQDTIKTI